MIARSATTKPKQRKVWRLLGLVLLIVALLSTAMPAEAATTYTLVLNPVSDDNIQIEVQTGSTTHWNQVLSSSTDSTYVSTTNSNWVRDRYNLADLSSSPGTILSVTVHMRVGHIYSYTTLESGAATYVQSGGTDYFGTAVTIPNAANLFQWNWGEYSTTYGTVPGTSSAWTAADVNNLRVGVSLKDSGAMEDHTNTETRCSKVWVTVEYRAPVTITPASLTTTEGGSPANFSVRLDAKPTAPVTIGLSSGDTSEGTVSPATITFTADAPGTPIRRSPSGPGEGAGDWSGSEYTKVDEYPPDDSDYILGQDVNSYGQAYRLYTFPSFNVPSNSKDISVTVFFRARENAWTLSNDSTVKAAVLVGGLLRVSDTSWHPPESGESYREYSWTWNTNPHSLSAWTVDQINGVSASYALTQIGVYASDLNPDVRFSAIWAVVNYTTTSNWNIPQTVTVTPVDDLIDDGDITYSIVTGTASSADPLFSGWNPDDISVTNTDNDISGIVVTPTSLTTTEGGGTTQFTVKLKSEPTDDVTVSLSSADTTEGTVSPASLTFLAPYTGPGYQARVPTGLAALPGGGTGGGTWTPSFGTNLYDPVADNTALTNPADIDPTYITSPLNASGGYVAFSYGDFNIPADATDISVSVSFRAKDSGTTGTNGLKACLWIGGNALAEPESTNPSGSFGLGGYTWSLNPSLGTAWTVDQINGSGYTPRYFGVYSSDLDPAIAVSQVYMTVHYNHTITPTWNIAQAVTVTPVDEWIDDGNITYNINAAASGGDYTGKTASVSVTNNDNDTASLSVSRISGLITTEAGGYDSFTIKMNSQPTADVTISVSSSDTTEGTVSPASITFTPAIWGESYPKEIRVTGVDDTIDDGDIAYSVITSAAVSADSVYNGMNPPDISVTNTDNDEGNAAPILASIGNKTVNELALLSFTAGATDVNSPTQTLTYSLDAASVTAGMTINSGTGAFSWTPTEAQNGSHSVTITVTDNGTPNLNDSETFTITVNEVNQAPVLTAIGSKSVSELALLSFTATATDGDLPANTLTFSLVNEPDGASITTGGAFTWTPSEAQGPVNHHFTVRVSDGTLIDEETITVTVNEVNVAPVLGTIGNKSVDELALLSFAATANDADLPTQTLTYSLDAASVAAGMTINSGTGAFSWTPSEAQGPGSYPVTITVTDIGTPNLNDSETITITVNEVTEPNVAPSLDAIGNKTVNELALLSFTAHATDADLPAQTLTYSLDAASVTAGMTINSDTGAFSWMPTEAQDGSHSVTITVTDNGTPNLNDSETFTVTVDEVNVAPVLNGVPATATIDELAPYTFDANATDADIAAQALTFSLVSGPTGAAIDGTSGVFTWTPSESQGPGTYDFSVRVSDGVANTDFAIALTVTEVNVSPVLGAVGNRAVDELTALTFTASASDADAPSQPLTFSLVDAPTGATINPTSGAFSWTPTEAQGSGAFTFDVVVADGALSDTETITVTVNEVNLHPVLGAIGNKTVNELTTLEFTVTATDADDPANVLTYSAPGLPAGATFDPATRTFAWMPGEEQGAGTYPVTIRVTDNGTPNLYDEETLNVTVNEVNVAPVLSEVPTTATIDELAHYTFDANATDADVLSQTLIFSLVGAPTGAIIDGTTGVFTWTPSESQGPGTHNFSVRVSDGVANTDSAVALTVTEVNTAPELGTIGNQTVDELVAINFTAAATDTDDPPQTLTYSLEGAPTGAAINPATGAFSWTPTEAQGPDTYTFDVVVSDGLLSDSETITITVNEVNVAPVLGAIGNKPVDELTTLEFTVTATDADNPANTLTYSATGLPTGATFDPAARTFNWKPTEAQGPGSYPVTITVTDNGAGPLSDGETITITVNEVNFAPILSDVPTSATIPELAPYTFDANTTDVDLPAQTLTFSLASAPTGTAIDPVTGIFTWTPSEAHGPGTYNFSVRVTDGVANTDSAISLTVTEVNTAPELGTIGNQTVDELVAINFTAAATDTDDPPQTLTYSLEGAPTGAAINSATGAFSWTPTEAQGPDTYTFDVVVSDGLISDSETITITVDETNAEPVLTAIGDKSVAWGNQLTLTLFASDSDIPDDILSFGISAGELLGMTIDPSTGAFTWTPTSDQIGPRLVTFMVTDDGSLSDSETITITVEKRSTTLTYTGDLEEQYSDVASLSATLTDTANGSAIAGKPIEFTIIGEGLSPVNTDASGIASTEYTIAGPAGTSYSVASGFAGDGLYKASSDSDAFEILHENATGDLQSEMTYKTEPGADYTNTLTLLVRIKEAYVSATGEPNGEPDARPGDIGLAEVTGCTLEPILGGSITGQITSISDASGSGYTGYRMVTCTFETDIPVNTYSLVLNIAGDYYTGTYETVIVVYDPSLGFTTGGGWFYWPEGTSNPELEGAKTNFGYTMKYNRKATSVQGSFLLIAHLPDGGIVRMKSNAVYGLAILNSTYPGEASFSGKCVYTRLDADGNILAEAGNQEFTAYVKDMDEPGTGADMFWFTTKLTVSSEDAFSLDSNDNGKVDEGECVTLGGGNIVVPHTSSNADSGEDTGDTGDTGETIPPGRDKKK